MLCGVSANTLNNIENGKKGMRVSTALNIMNVLDIKLQIAPWSK